MAEFIPPDFAVPLRLETSEFVLEPLGPEHNEQDYDAWTSSMEHIAETPGFPDGSWPREMTPDENRADLERHADDFRNRKGFTYTVLDPGGRDAIGCVYIYPLGDRDHAASVLSWVRKSHAHLDAPLRRVVSEWVESDWPFATVDYAGRAQGVEASEPPLSQLADRQLTALAEVASLLDSGGFDHWLFGGWAVDFHVGAVTRSHGDVDLAVWADDAEAIHSALVANGWEHRPAADEDGGTGYARDDVRVELTYLAGSENGQVFVALRDRNVLWTERPLGQGVLGLHGARIRVISLELLKDGKSRPRSEPAEAAVDRADFAALSRLARE